MCSLSCNSGTENSKASYSEHKILKIKKVNAQIPTK